MLNVFTKFYKIEKKQHGILLNTFSISLIIFKRPPLKHGPGNELGARRPEQFWKLHFNPCLWL